MKRVFICAKQDFPRGSAGANYIQYLSLAFAAIGYTPIVISDGNYGKCDNIYGKYLYRGIELINPFSSNRIIRHVQYRWGTASPYIRTLRNFGLDKSDIVVTYLTDKTSLIQIEKYVRKKGAMLWACIVEWLSRNVFDSDRSFERYNVALSEIIPEFDVVLPISTFIAEKYSNKKCKVLTIPIMADTSEFSFDEKDEEKTRRFIFTANGKIKDALLEMLLSLEKYYLEENQTFEFHITNFTEEKLEKLIVHLSEQKKVNIKNFVRCYGWLEYEELVDLYKKMDFLLLARKTEQMSLANFPSKVPEAMCHGVIPIVSRVGDYTAYYLKDEYDSIIFDGYEVEQCVLAVKRAMSLTSLEMKTMCINARRTAEQRFDYHSWLDQLNSYTRK